MLEPLVSESSALRQQGNFQIGKILSNAADHFWQNIYPNRSCSADAHLLLGRIHLRNGRVQEAIAAFKLALWSAETADVHVALGEAYRQAKDPDAARAEAERALALDPSSADARALLQRLDSR